ncbi:MAG: beta-galactosidase, partial [Bacteroidaceae bacterium]|nr:beta-galactosidase [Bacteroidaceae bacterium]
MKVNRILYLILFFVAAMTFSACGNKKRSMTVENSVITLDGEMYTVASADFDYARVPQEYWNDRLENMARMGLNTITVKVPWM